MKKDLIQSIKIVTLSLIIGLGVSIVYATDWTAPLSSAPTCTSGNPGCDTPINVSDSDQTKAGGLSIGTTFLPGSGQIYAAAGGLHKGLSIFTRADNNSPALEVGDSSTGLYPRFKIDRFASDVNERPGIWDVNNTCSGDEPDCFTYPAPVCADSNGYLILCPGPGDAVVNLTVDQPTISTTEVTSISQAVNLTWTTTNLVGATCTGTQNNSATGFTATPSYAGGTDGATVEKFGTTTFTISCTPAGGGTAVTDTATVLATGYKTYSRGTTFTPESTEFNSGTTFTIKAVGGGGGGDSFSGVFGDYVGTEGGNGTSTSVTKGVTIVTAAGGGGGTYTAPGDSGTVSGITALLSPGVAGAGSTGVSPLWDLGSYSHTINCGGLTSQNIQYGKGGGAACGTEPGWAPAQGYGGAGGSQTVTSTWTSGSYTFSLGVGGAGGSGSVVLVGDGESGGKGAVRFEW